jgi:hypothetical protein
LGVGVGVPPLAPSPPTRNLGQGCLAEAAGVVWVVWVVMVWVAQAGSVEML